MALSTAETQYLRTKVGSGVDPAVLQEAYDRLLDLDAVAREILEIRRADLLAQPDSFTVVGEYSQSTAKQLEGIDSVLASLGGISDLGSGSVRVVDPAASDPR